MDDLEQLIRETATERTSDRFTAGVMEKIRPLPIPGTASSVLTPLWFKIMMTGVFTGALIFAFLFAGKDPDYGGIMAQSINQGLGYFSGLFSAFMVWINMHIGLIPSILFSLAGTFYLLTRKQGIHTQYI